MLQENDGLTLIEAIGDNNNKYMGNKRVKTLISANNFVSDMMMNMVLVKHTNTTGIRYVQIGFLNNALRDMVFKTDHACCITGRIKTSIQGANIH